LTLRQRDGAVFKTDSGNVIYDIAFGAIQDAPKLARQYQCVPGVVEHGLFIGIATTLLIAADGEIEVHRKRRAVTKYDYDLFVIRRRFGGVRASRMAAMAGRRVALAEEWRMGGTCVIRGCIPKKAVGLCQPVFRECLDAAVMAGISARPVSTGPP
jgi:hypothetical protein